MVGQWIYILFENKCGVNGFTLDNLNMPSPFVVPFGH